MDDFGSLIAFFELHIPFNALLGMKVEALTAGECSIRVPSRPELIGDPIRGAIHGGVISSLADTAGGLAVFAQFADTPPVPRVSTVDLRVDYLRPGRVADLWCDARVLRAGNRVAVTTMVVHQDEGRHIVAEARAVYNLATPRPEDP